MHVVALEVRVQVKWVVLVVWEEMCLHALRKEVT
jgi:hypothetical protein